jgi:nicotinamidase-related amidase
MPKHRLEASDTVLLIIDLQQNLMKVMDQAEKVYKNTNLILSLAGKVGIPVLVTEQYPQGLGQTVPEVAANLGEHTLMEKNCFSACMPELLGVLDRLGRRQVLVAGSETHICVFQTVRDLIEAGYQPYVLADAVCSRFKENFENGLDLMKNEGAVVTNAETVIFDLLKMAGTPEFKSMSKLLK